MILSALAGLAFAYYRSHTDPERIRTLAEAYLQQFAEHPVTVGAASFSWRRGARLFDVAVTEPAPQPLRENSEPPDSGRLASRRSFWCQEIELGHAPWALLLGRFEIRSITAIEPTCRIVRNASTGRTDVAGLRLAPAAGTDLPTLPTFELRDARVHFLDRSPASVARLRLGGSGVVGDSERPPRKDRMVEVRAEPARERSVEELRLTIRAMPPSHDSRLFDIAWQGGARRAASGRCRLDTQTGRLTNLSGGLPWLSIEAVMIAVNAEYEQAGAWSDLLGLAGDVRASDFTLSLRGAADGPLSATIELDDASLSIPIHKEEQPLPPDQRYLRFQQVDGTISVTAEKLHAEFDAVFHGSACSVRADLRGGDGRFEALEDIAFDVRIAARELQLPRTDLDAPAGQRRFVEHLAPVARFYRAYDPHGAVDIDIVARKEPGADQPIRVDRMTLVARGTDALCRWFPYRVENLTGAVEFRPDGVFLRELRGVHGDGQVRVDGWLELPKRWAAAKLVIGGRNILIDDDLYAAVPDAYRRAAMRFDPAGTVDVELAMDRPAGVGEVPAKWRSYCALSFNDLSACYEELPYPLAHAAGTVLIDENIVQIDGVRAHMGDTVVEVDGIVATNANSTTGPGGRSIRELAVAVRGRDVPIDDCLRTALPTELRDGLQRLNATGRLDIESFIKRGSTEQHASVTTDVRVQGASIRPGAAAIAVHDIAGSLTIAPHGLELRDVTGRIGQGTISLSGTLRAGDGGQLGLAPERAGAAGGIAPPFDLSITTRDVALNERTLSLIPEGLRRPLAAWTADGSLHVDCNVRREEEAPAEAVAVNGVARFDGATVHHSLFPVPFGDVRGEIRFSEDGLQSEDLTARYGAASVRVALDARDSGEATGGTVTLDAQGVALDEMVRDILPEALRDSWQKHRVAGTVDLLGQRLQFRRDEPGSRFVWKVDGRIDLSDVSWRGLTPVEQLRGSMTVGGQLVDRLGGTVLGGDLAVQRATLFGHEVTDLTTPWSLVRVADGSGRLSLDALRAEALDGIVTAKVELNFDETASRYDVSAVGQNLDIGPMDNRHAAPGAPRVAGPSTPVPAPLTHAVPAPSTVRGRADAQLYLTGTAGKPASKLGGGMVDVREGYLYRLPIMLALLNVANLTTPERDVLDEARASFYIVGNRMELEDIVLRGDGLALVGSGTLSIPDRGLDLEFVSISPHDWMRLPVLASLVEGATRKIVALHATGSLGHPQVKAKPFRGVNEELKQLFKKKKPRAIQPEPR